MNLIFEVQGMTCQRCVTRVKLAAMSVGGVEAVEVNLTAGVVNVSTPEDDATTESLIAQAISDAGYPSSAKKIATLGQ